MKNLIIIAALLSLTAFSACKKESTTQPITSSTDNGSDKGGIILRVKDINNNALANAKVSLSASSNDLASAVYLATVTTDVSGIANMGRYSQATYYFKVSATFNSADHAAQGAMQAINGKDITQDIQVN